MAKRIVIIGGVAAGPKAAVRVKRLLPDSEVILVDQDSLISYGGCGIPYYVSGDVPDEKELRSTSFHRVRDPKFFAEAKGLIPMTSTRAVSIDRKKRQVTVENVSSGEQSVLDYDLLMLATGAAPIDLPVAGRELDGVFTISDLHKAIEIKDRIAKGRVSKAVVVGGGAIGLEMAEALKDLWGVETSLVEYADRLLPRAVGWEMSAMLVRHLRDNGIDVYLGEGAEEIIGVDGKVTGLRTGARTLEADMVILAAGVRPRSELARDAGLQVSANGCIVVNERMQTSDPLIYAAGDCVEIMNLVTGKRFFAPFGSLANKEGRVAADNMAGVPSVFKGGVGSFIMKAFDICIGAVGLSLDAARAEGFEADCSLTCPSDRAHFYPGHELLFLQVVFDRRTRRVLGMQGVGPMNDGLSARLDAAAVAIANGALIDDLYNVEMCYAPPFSAAIDAINAAGYVAENLCDGRMKQLDLKELSLWMEGQKSHPDWQVLDVRHPKEAEPFLAKYGERWMALPYEEIRQRYQELPAEKTIIVFCNAGSRSYEVQLFLASVGITNTLVVPGGYNFLRKIGVRWLDNL